MMGLWDGSVRRTSWYCDACESAWPALIDFQKCLNCGAQCAVSWRELTHSEAEAQALLRAKKNREAFAKFYEDRELGRLAAEIDEWGVTADD